MLPRQHWHTWVLYIQGVSVLAGTATYATSAAFNGLGLHGIAATPWGSNLSHVAYIMYHVSPYQRVHGYFIYIS